MHLVKYIRLFRESTGSWLTIKLPKEMELDLACSWGEKRFKGWMVKSGTYNESE
jgi:hypothetical protein